MRHSVEVCFVGRVSCVLLRLVLLRPVTSGRAMTAVVGSVIGQSCQDGAGHKEVFHSKRQIYSCQLHSDVGKEAL